MDKAVLGIMAEVTCCSTDVLNIDHLMEKKKITQTGLNNSREGEPMVFSRYPVSMLFCPCYWKGFTQI